MASILPRENEFHGRGVNLAIFSIVFNATAASLVASRVATRTRNGRSLGSDDYAIVLSVLISVGLTATNCVAVEHGSGKVSTTLTPANLHIALKAFWAAQILYKFTINLTKTSICLLYLRIFPLVSFRRTVYVVMAYVNLYAFSSIIATIFQCSPIERVWNKKVAGTCINLTAFWYANASANILGDFLILGLPMPLISNLNLPRHQKWGLYLVFALGGFVCVTSILRMTTLKTGSQATDVTYGTLNSTIWTTIESNTAIICACLPMLKTPLAALFPQLFPRGTNVTREYSAGGSSGYRRHSDSPAAPSNAYDEYGRLQSKRPHELIRVPTSTTKASSTKDSTLVSKSSDEIFSSRQPVPKLPIAKAKPADASFPGRDGGQPSSPQKPSPAHQRTPSRIPLVAIAGHEDEPSPYCYH